MNAQGQAQYQAQGPLLTHNTLPQPTGWPGHMYAQAPNQQWAGVPQGPPGGGSYLQGVPQGVWSEGGSGLAVIPLPNQSDLPRWRAQACCQAGLTPLTPPYRAIDAGT